MTIQRTKKQKAFLALATLTDIGSLIMSFFYIAYVVLMIILKVGPGWLNGVMVAITVLYSWFVLFKIVYLNRVMQRAGRVKRIVKMSSKYTKFVLRVINAAFVILTLIGTRFWDSVEIGHIIAIIGIVVMSLSLALSIFLDVVGFVIRWNVKRIISTRAGNKAQIEDPQVIEAYGEVVKNDE